MMKYMTPSDELKVISVKRHKAGVFNLTSKHKCVMKVQRVYKKELRCRFHLSTFWIVIYIFNAFGPTTTKHRLISFARKFFFLSKKKSRNAISCGSLNSSFGAVQELMQARGFATIFVCLYMFRV
eukprot:57230_1